METIVKITGFSNKPTKDKTKTFPCFDILRDGSPFSIGVFEDDVINPLKSRMDKWVVVEMTQRPKTQYWNIVRFIRDATPEEITEMETQKPQRVSQVESITAGGSVPNKVIHEIVDLSPRNWAEFGKAGERFKVYFKDLLDFEDKYKEIILKKRQLDQELNTDEE